MATASELKAAMAAKRKAEGMAAKLVELAFADMSGEGWSMVFEELNDNHLEAVEQEVDWLLDCIREEQAVREAVAARELQAMDEDGLLKTACDLYASTRPAGAIPQQPSQGLSTVSAGKVILRNINGVLAKYRLQGGKLVEMAS